MVAHTREVAASVNQESKDDGGKVINVVSQKCGNKNARCSDVCVAPTKSGIVALLKDNMETVQNITALKKLPAAVEAEEWKRITESIMGMNTCPRAQTKDDVYLLDHYLPEKENPHTRAFIRGDISGALGRTRGGKSKKRVKRTRKKGRIAIASGIRKRVRRMRTKIRRRRGNKSKRKI